MPGLRWGKSEVRSLKRQFRKVLLLEKVNLVGRSFNSIRAKATRLGLIHGYSRKPWTKMEEKILRDYIANGWSALDIVKAFKIIADLSPLAHYSRNAIQKKMQRLKLANKAKSNRAKKVKLFTQEEKIEFREFLVANYLEMTPEQLAKAWNKGHATKVKRGRVISHLTTIERKLPWKTIINMPYSKAKRRRSRKRQTLRMLR